MSVAYWVPALVGGLVSVVSPLILRPILERLRVVDLPNERSSHVRPTLRAGGIGQLLGVLAAGTAAIALTLSSADFRTFVTVLAAGVAASLIGLMDDLSRGRGISVLLRAFLQLGVGTVTALLLDVPIGLSGWALVVAAVFIAAYINMANFMDGINGISSAHGVVVGLTQFAIGLIFGLPWMQVLGLVVASTFLAFLPWNLAGAGMFLGDVGSYLLGALAGAGMVGAVFAGVPVIVAVSPLAVYLADTVMTIIRRAVRGEPVLRAHRSHAYQRLINTGMSHLTVTAIVTAASLSCVLVAFATRAHELPSAVAVCAMLAICAAYLALPRLRGDLLPPGPRVPVLPGPPPGMIRERPGFNPQRWAVFGASGFIGGAVVADLRSRGIDAIPLSAPRLLMDPRSDGKTVAVLASELPETEELAAALSGVDVVINAAGLATPDAPDSPSLYGANALLPAVIYAAAQRAGATRVVHLSSAAVQGRKATLDESAEVAPFSPYSRSKALGERATIAAAESGMPDLVIIRATSVQGDGRRTTESLRRIAHSSLSSVAAPGTQPTVVSSLTGLSEFVFSVGRNPHSLCQIVLQPWEGLSVSDVMRLAGGREPRVLPRSLCKGIVFIGTVVGRVVPEVSGVTRRVEIMWFGQRQGDSSVIGSEIADPGSIRALLQGNGAAV